VPVLIKVLLLLGVAAVVAVGLRPPSGARHLALRRIAIAGFAALAVLSVLFPDAWNAAARLVGVGRGTDLLLYGTIVVFLLYMVTTYRRFRAMETQITLLARRVAIDEARMAGEVAVADTDDAGGSAPAPPST
jgi:hypothetical protein